MFNIIDVKRGTLKKAENPPGSESPLQFDTYTLNHAAFVGMNEVCVEVTLASGLS